MRILDKSEFFVYKNIHLAKVKRGAVFIYPTDTIYGLGCDATNGESIKKIRELKDRTKQPFSIIAPSIKWIYDNCEVEEHAKDWLEKLPGPYTLIFKLKNTSSLHSNVNKDGEKTIGVRIPNHWISEFVSDLGRPIITTSPNRKDQEPMTHPDDLEIDFRTDINFTIYDGTIRNTPSTVVKLTDSKHEFLRVSKVFPK